MQRIEIDTVMLQNSINSVDTYINDLVKEIEAAYEGIRHLDTMWDGDANTAFNVQFENDYNRMIEICGILRDYNSRLRQAKKQYDDGENHVHDIVAAIRV